jgi:hypothetical protein
MTSSEALEFVANRIERQATSEGVSLTEVERKMLRWSEVEPGACKEMDISERFEHEFDVDEWEEKIVELAKRAYVADDKSPVTAQFWADARIALRGHDYYLLTMTPMMSGPSAETSGVYGFILRFVTRLLSPRP